MVNHSRERVALLKCRRLTWGYRPTDCIKLSMEHDQTHDISKFIKQQLLL